MKARKLPGKGEYHILFSNRQLRNVVHFHEMPRSNLCQGEMSELRLGRTCPGAVHAFWGSLGSSQNGSACMCMFVYVVTAWVQVTDVALLLALQHNYLTCAMLVQSVTILHMNTTTFLCTILSFPQARHLSPRTLLFCYD